MPKYVGERSEDERAIPWARGRFTSALRGEATPTVSEADAVSVPGAIERPVEYPIERPIEYPGERPVERPSEEDRPAEENSGSDSDIVRDLHRLPVGCGRGGVVGLDSGIAAFIGGALFSGKRSSSGVMRSGAMRSGAMESAGMRSVMAEASVTQKK